MIEVENLTKKYGDLVAVKNLNFKVEKGKIWGLLGPNAAGKTTTMRILTGYLPATDGKAFVANYDVFEKPNDVKKIIGYLPENVPLYPEMTVHSYLSFVSEIKQIPASQRKEHIEKAVEMSGLEPVRKRLIKNISRGFKQRVGIAQALIHDPQVLVLDEPTAGLDPAQIIEIRKLIKSLKGEQTILLSTHILAEVTQTCDGVVIINEGNLMASGSLEELTASFKEKEGVVIKLKKGGKDVLSLLQKIHGVDEVSHADDEFKIEWTKGKDMRDEITKLIVDKELGLIEMRPLAMNIEDLYLKVISGGVAQ
ncbi:MAG TPA: ABC transporter ATP-binding protein [Candidatus Aminicenantes bacterium]|nr:ABC transporter ATP-binding protein [Candidatus Aminicenantes bacterium]HEB35818.1 ABC transporter ATP-binding protein [Candidatus Aminicenantes bacterium]